MDRTQCWISVRSEFSELRYNGISICEKIYGVVTSWCGTVIDCICQYASCIWNAGTTDGGLWTVSLILLCHAAGIADVHSDAPHRAPRRRC